MPKKLVIVESPAKTKSIGKYLGKDFKVVSSKGHIRDLATRGKFGLGVDIEDHFKPNYVAIRGKKKDIDALKKDVKSADFVYLATDPDREGEAISWHLYDALGLKDDEYERIVFNEITEHAVQDSLKHARKIDQDLVNSQEARRILDRIIGFRLSKLIQSKTSGSSAGRVQSVALKLIVDREREIQAFNSEEYWTIKSIFKDFEADLFEYKDEKVEIKDETQAEQIISKLKPDYEVIDISKKVNKKQGKSPFTTSTLQQEASSKLGFTPKKTMMLAQKLYEGIELEQETVGLISYMRTDSIRFSDEFVFKTFGYIEEKYGKDYVGFVKKSKAKDNVQDAHEAIRPTSIERTPEQVRPYLSNDEFKLYRLIYYRALASLMAPAKVNHTTIILNNEDYHFKTTGQVMIFDGYLKVYDYENTKENILPEEIKKDVLLQALEVKKEQHFTQPPARYTEATLVKEMDELGIGRPSTYSPTLDRIKSRGYVKVEDKKLFPTKIGFEITDKLQEYFSHLINVKYTSDMESDLDKIAEGKKIWYQIVESFYNDFEPAVEKAFDNMEKKEPEKTGEDCPNCGNPLVVRLGRYGSFVACSNYPTCKYVKAEARDEKVVCDCPNCQGKIVVKRSRKGRVFYGCNNYPDCKTAFWDEPTGNKCPDCQQMLVKKAKKIKCSSCSYEVTEK